METREEGTGNKGTQGWGTVKGEDIITSKERTEKRVNVLKKNL